TTPRRAVVNTPPWLPVPAVSASPARRSAIASDRRPRLLPPRGTSCRGPLRAAERDHLAPRSRWAATSRRIDCTAVRVAVCRFAWPRPLHRNRRPPRRVISTTGLEAQPSLIHLSTATAPPLLSS